LDEKDREWLVKASQVDYHALAKLAAEKPNLVYLRVSTDFCVFNNIFTQKTLQKIHSDGRMIFLRTGNIYK